MSRSRSAWARSLSCEDVSPLIICRGPIRKEAMDVFTEMGITHYGILLSEKDSVTYTNALAPELRAFTDPDRVHRVPDYSGATKEERQERIAQLIEIAHTHGYNSVFAGYGFMSEDAEMVSAMERAGLRFIGPSSQVQAAAGLKDEAKRTALRAGVSVTPGVDDATTRALLKRAPTAEALLELAERAGLELSAELKAELLNSERSEGAGVVVGRILELAHASGLDLYSLEEVIDALRDGIREIWLAKPHFRVRLKAISGGGGKGQRILSAPDSYTEHSASSARLEEALKPVSELVREVLAEVKCLGVGDNKNVVAELNIEQTSHQEIQVAGNGDWCITLGGRDCSLQMHEQKLLEISVTEEELTRQIDAQPEGSPLRGSLERSRATLARMEDEAARFGQAVGLDSVSTFECIVSDAEHYFMEMNTRIQVEHRVTELCYALRFTNPQDPEDSLEVTSLVELMVLIARHGAALPKPTREPRYGASVEARINATNDALKPHAGGVITEWSAPISGEVRDDQGISSPNPDTGAFMRYHLAGAYDSNIALLLTVGEARRESYEAMLEVIRLTKMRGEQLCTNMHFHYGLLRWLLSWGVYARPSTKFVSRYLAGVGALKREADRIDLDVAWRALQKRAGAEAREVFNARATLVLRPLELLLGEPHLLAGWLSSARDSLVGLERGEVRWTVNPLEVLCGLYQTLNLERRAGRPALQQVWDHDEELLQRGLAFYRQLSARLNIDEWESLAELLERPEPPLGFESARDEWAKDQETRDQEMSALWDACRASHRGHQAGLELLSLVARLGLESEFYSLRVDERGDVITPEAWCDPERQAELTLYLAPPPVARSGELVAPSGGMFYPREAPDQPKLIEVGDHFEEGQPLYIIEVMKMFNKVYAPFSGTITEALVEGEGVIIKKGQPLFLVKPDHELVEVNHDQERAQRIARTLELLG